MSNTSEKNFSTPAPQEKPVIVAESPNKTEEAKMSQSPNPKENITELLPTKPEEMKEENTNSNSIEETQRPIANKKYKNIR